MRRARMIGSAVWDFVAGDDWRTAAGVVLALGLTALIAQAGSSAWWIMPPTVLGLLALSIRRAARDASKRRPAATCPDGEPTSPSDR